MPLIVKVRLLEAFLKERGWIHKNTEGDHHQYIHPTLPGKVTVPGQPNLDLAPGTLDSILKQAKITKKELRTWLNR